jgi:hypothetical protein
MHLNEYHEHFSKKQHTIHFFENFFHLIEIFEKIGSCFICYFRCRAGYLLLKKRER